MKTVSDFREASFTSNKKDLRREELGDHRLSQYGIDVSDYIDKKQIFFED